MVEIRSTQELAKIQELIMSEASDKRTATTSAKRSGRRRMCERTELIFTSRVTYTITYIIGSYIIVINHSRGKILRSESFM